MARWTDLAAWVGHTINEGDGDNTPLEAADRLTDVRGMVLHIASGFYDGTISWQRNANADVSSHFIVGRDGRCAQMVDTADRSWAQRAGNSTWLSVELEGFAPDDPLHAKHPGWERLTDAQIEVCARLFARAHQTYGAAKVPLQLATSPTGRGLGHHSMGAENGYDWGHSQCPGTAIKAQKPTILARAKQIVAGTPTSSIGADVELADQINIPTYEAPAPGVGIVLPPTESQSIATVLGATYRRSYLALHTVTTVLAILQAVAKKVDLDPDELQQIEARAKAGAAAAFEEHQADFIAALLAALPTASTSGYTVDQVQAAVRAVFADAGQAGDAPTV